MIGTLLAYHHMIHYFVEGIRTYDEYLNYVQSMTVDPDTFEILQSAMTMGAYFQYIGNYFCSVPCFHQCNIL